MALPLIAHLVTHSGRQRELAAVLQFRVQLAFEAQQDVPSPAPVIRQVTGRVLDHAHAGIAEMAGAPHRMADSAWVGGGFDR
ncbi:hypothetical protein QFZ38_004137 [Pseudomonas cedrina]|nr:hypothetical protein [Pseudomonas cedrina]